MRVVAGRFRGSILTAPAGRRTRPITDRAKESLFNVLGHRFGSPGWLPAIAVLDLFAGTGSLGIEALSRGATSCVFVERDPRALRALRANIEKLGLAEETRVLTDSAWTMRMPPAEPDGYSLIFVDPPYRDVADTLRMQDLFERTAPRLAADGLIAFRHELNTEFPVDELRTLESVDERHFGLMRVLLLARRPPAQL